ncbi:MAG: beta-eliminating lyase-related protein [Hornefia sp.]|nr:beta-eliminating lyase-related protein [Hornefia sp.]
MKKLNFASDYMEGAHPLLLLKLMETNLKKTVGYGDDEYCSDAEKKILRACNCPNGSVHFLVGGTQTNATVLAAVLKSYEGVIAVETGHVNTHEAGAIELTGHKVFALPHNLGKLEAAKLRKFIQTFLDDENKDHMVHPGAVYISQPTEYGTLYSKSELEEIYSICKVFGIKLYIDGARLAYALASPENDVSLSDLAANCDIFYIGGTKCGALFGEAVVLPDKHMIPDFFPIIKQHGACLAKGRLHGIQFGTLFENDLYMRIGKPAIESAIKLQNMLLEKGYQLFYHSPTNQVFVVIENDKMESLSEKVIYEYSEKYDDTHTVIRFCTSWASDPKEIDILADML